MEIRQMKKEDMEEVFCMMRVFYDSPAVLIPTSDETLRQVIRDCVGECPYIQGYIFDESGEIAGYAMAATGYSTEYGGICIWLEDLYVRETFRGKKIAQAFFAYLENEYKGKAVRIRLEVEAENERAMAVYRREGYEQVPYLEMSKDIREE